MGINILHVEGDERMENVRAENGIKGIGFIGNDDKPIWE